MGKCCAIMPSAMKKTEMSKKFQLKTFLPHRLALLSAHASNGVSQIYHLRHGLSRAQWRTIAVLAEYGEVGAGDIAQMTSMDKVKISRALKNLAAQKIIVVRSDPKDARRKYASLAAAGQKIYRDITPRVLVWERDLLATLTPQQRKSLQQTLTQLERALHLYTSHH